MSRYVRLPCPNLTLQTLREELDARGVVYETGTRRRLMLQGSLECRGEPVDLRCAPGVADAVEDFGFVVEDGRVHLVCGDVDREVIEAELLRPLLQSAAERRVRATARRAGLEVEKVRTEDGVRKLVLKDRG